MTQDAVPNPAAPQSATYIAYQKKKNHIIFVPIIVDVHDFILGWKIVYLSARLSLSVCFI